MKEHIQQVQQAIDKLMLDPISNCNTIKELSELMLSMKINDDFDETRERAKEMLDQLENL